MAKSKKRQKTSAPGPTVNLRAAASQAQAAAASTLQAIQGREAMQQAGSLLLAATAQRSIETFRTLGKAGVPLDLPIGPHGVSPVYFFTGKQDIEMVRELLALGAPPDTPVDDGSTPLHVAAEQGFLELAELLLEAGADIEDRGAGGCSPLELAIEMGRREMVALLAKRGADLAPSSKRVLNEFPLEAALKAGQRDIASDLYELAPPGALFKIARLAAGIGHLDILGKQLDLGVPLEGGGEGKLSLLAHAAQTGCLESVAFLLERGADPGWVDEYHSTPLSSAALGLPGLLRGEEPETASDLEARKKILDLLLDAGGLDLEDDQAYQGVFEAMAEGSSVELARHLASRIEIPEILPDGDPLICTAVLRMGGDLVKFLLERGHGLTHADHDGYLPLHFAVKAGNLEATRVMLDAGADIDAKDREGTTALIHVALEPELGMDLADLLLARGAQVDVADEHGWTALFYAVDNDDPPMVKRLLKAGADKNREDSKGMTPLLLARKANRRDALKAMRG
jgi:ankyrin repeat protein